MVPSSPTEGKLGQPPAWRVHARNKAGPTPRSFAGGWVYIGCLRFGMPSLVAGVFAALTIVGLRIVSHAFGVRVPDPLWIRRNRGDSGRV